LSDPSTHGRSVAQPIDRERSGDDLVRRAARGDVEAYEMIYRQHVGRVHALCLRMARDRAEAEELTQETFVRVWERLGLVSRRQRVHDLAAPRDRERRDRRAAAPRPLARALHHIGDRGLRRAVPAFSAAATSTSSARSPAYHPGAPGVPAARRRGLQARRDRRADRPRGGHLEGPSAPRAAALAGGALANEEDRCAGGAPPEPLSAEEQAALDALVERARALPREA
jgi:hypothetical protein